MRILFLTHYFPPEVNAPANRTYEHCLRWARAGHEVTVLTCAPNCPDGVVFPGYRNRLRRSVEECDGIRVVRVWTYVAPNAGTLRRIANYVSYMLSATWASLRLGRPDVVIATSPQFFCGWAGVFVSRLKRAPLVLEIRDIWPESISAVGAIRNRPLLAFLEMLERRMYRAADRIVAVGNGYKEHIARKLGSADRISVITNGVDADRFSPRPADAELKQRFHVGERFVCSYIGTIGMAHGLEVVIRAAALLKQQGRGDICFLLVGDGAARAALEEEAKRSGVEDVVLFTGRQPHDQMPPLLALSNACLVHLKACELFETVIPSKIFETMAMQRPIIMGVAGEARDIVLRANAGIPMTPDSPESLVECVCRLADDPTACDAMGESGRQFVRQEYDRHVLADQFLEVVGDLVHNKNERAPSKTRTRHSACDNRS